jgi:8-oxo-dGTP pyrophosphatase MutT (NUDIX family)
MLERVQHGQPDHSTRASIMTWKPHVTVAAIVERDGRFLMVEERVNGRIVLNQPAGHLDENEGLIDAVIRETREETAWEFSPDAISGVYLWKSPRKGTTYLRWAFVGDVDNHDAGLPLDHGILRAVWMSREELTATPDRLRSTMVLRCIDDYLAGQRFPLSLLTDFGAA